MITSNLNFDDELTCFSCKKYELANPDPQTTNTKKVMEKAGKDDEEEWGRISIPQSDDSDDDTWNDESTDSLSEQREDSQPLIFNLGPKRNNSMTKLITLLMPITSEDLTFLVGPRRDGISRKKDGTLIMTDNLPPLTHHLHISTQASDPPWY
jgi:hypothetical protein